MIQKEATQIKRNFNLKAKQWNMIENKTMNEDYDRNIEDESWSPLKDKTSFYTPTELISNNDVNHDKTSPSKVKKISENTNISDKVIIHSK